MRILIKSFILGTSLSNLQAYYFMFRIFFEPLPFKIASDKLEKLPMTDRSLESPVFFRFPGLRENIYVSRAWLS